MSRPRLFQSRLTRLFALFALPLWLAACGGGGTAGSVSPVSTHAMLMRVAAETAGANCTAGGSRIAGGIDSNGDGVLSEAEITGVQYVCNGAPGVAGAMGAPGAAGSDGLSTLVVMTDEPPGGNCTAGGKKLSAGKDSDANGVLDAAEVTSVGYICNGASGASGTNGTNGLNSLLAVTAEPAGPNCTYGGSQVTSGLDSNGNGTLDAGEVAATSYLCNAAPSGGLAWVDVRGTSVLAQVNTGYLASNAAQVTVTLPTAPAIGDVVRVSGVGSGGWKVVQQTGQSIITAAVPSALLAWAPHEQPRNWRHIASSADGTKLVAADALGQLYTSTDSGTTWTARDANRNWNPLASSADGTRLVAAEFNGQIYTSSDSGATWTPRGMIGHWNSLASSADGIKLVAADQGGYLYTSGDAGVSWTQRKSPGGWSAVASSSDGTKLVAMVEGDAPYTSTDSGISWTQQVVTYDLAPPWSSVASSSDGTKLVAVATNGGRIYTSTDSGGSWTAHENSRNWYDVASSSDGTRLAAVVQGGQIYTSADSGATWTVRETDRMWQGVASSADGMRLAAVVGGHGQIYTNDRLDTTTPGSAGYITGAQYEAVELQYVGGGMFSVLSYVGSLLGY